MDCGISLKRSFFLSYEDFAWPKCHENNEKRTSHKHSGCVRGPLMLIAHAQTLCVQKIHSFKRRGKRQFIEYQRTAFEFFF